MKLALLVALATVAAVAAYTPSIHSAMFKPGEEYVYHYRGQVLSGIPKSSSQFSGLLIDSIVVLQFQQDYKVVMKMEKIKLFKVNDKVTTLPSELLPESELTHMTGEQTTVIVEQLVKPLKFRYDEGEVREIEKETHDQYWSVNIKKGILSLFQVTLKEKSSFSSDSSSSYVDPTTSRINSRYNSRSGSSSTPYWMLANKSNSVYKVMETDVTGECETKYTLISDKTHLSPSSSKMQVSAVRNFDNCVSKPFYIQGLFQGVYRYPTEKDLIQPVVHTEYVITGDRTHFLIKEATLRGKYFFLVSGLEGGDISTHVLQHLTLKTTQPITTPVRLTSSKLDTRGLIMIIPQASMLPEKKSFDGWMGSSSKSRGSDEYIGYRRKLREELRGRTVETEPMEDEEMVAEETSDIVPVIERKLSELVHCLYPLTDKKCSDFLYDLSHVVRHAKHHQLKAVLVRYLKGEESSSETDYRKAEILLDILPTLPSPDAAKVLVELIKERLISELRGSVLIKAMSLLVKPTPSVIKSILELFKELPKERSSTISSKTMLRQSLLLSVGTLTHRLINVMRSHGKPVPEIVSFIDGISSELKRMLEQTQSESEKVLVLKSLGNMGVSESIVVLKQHVEDPRQPIRVRLSAVFALRRLAKQFNKQVVPILLGVFMDTKEARELRQAAFVVLVNANPSFTTLQTLANRLRHEPHAQIRTLVYSSLVNLAMHTSHEPEHKTLAKNARLILKTIPPVRVGVYDSMAVFVNKFSEKFDLGGALNLIKIKSKMSGMPEALIANLQGTLFGKHRRLLEVGAEGKSLEVILRKVFGPHGLLKEILKGQVTLQDFIKPLTRPDMGRVEVKLREFLSKMMMELRTDEEPFGAWYIHVLGNELEYVLLNSENIEEVVRKVTEIIPKLFLKLTRGVKVDIVKSLSNIATVTIASPLGIPLTLNLTTMGIVKVDGHVKVNNLPSWPEMVSRLSMPLAKISLDVDIKPAVDVTNYFSMGADLRWLSIGAGAEASVRVMKPIKFSVNVNTPEHSLTVKYFIPKEPIKMLHAKFSPYTYVKYIPTTIHKLPMMMEVKEIKNEEIVKISPFQHKYTCSISGTEVETRGTYSLCGPSWCPIMPLFGKQELISILRPVSSVDYVIIKVKSLRSNIEFEGIPASRPTHELYEETDDDEEVENYKRTSRTSGRSMIESSEFEPITVDPVFQNEPIKRQLLITVGSNTQQSPKVKTLVTWLMGRTYWKNQINVQVVRSSHGDMPAWKIHLNNVVNPLNQLFWYPEETFKGETEFLNKMTLVWNIGGETKELKVKIIPGSPFDFSHDLKEHSLLTADSLPEARAQKYKYTLIVDLPHMTPKMLKYMTILHDAIKYQMYNKLTTAIPHHPLTNKVIVSVELLPWWEKMNIIVKTPREDSYISSVPLFWNPFQPTSEKIRLHDSPAWSWYNRTSEEEEQPLLDTVPYTAAPLFGGKCTMTQTHLTTFDGVRRSLHPLYKYAVKGCSLLHLQDCSSQGLITITGGMRTNTEYAWTALVPKYEITITGAMGLELEAGNIYSLTVNGEETPLELSRPVVIREERDANSKPLYKIEKISPKSFIFTAYELGLTFVANVEESKYTYKISPLSMLQGQLCGACGDFNQDQSDDFETPYNMKRRPNSDLLSSHMVPSETCDVDKISALPDDDWMHRRG